MYTIRIIEENDAPLLRSLAQKCYPLDVHTPYTYWVVAKYYGATGCVIEDAGVPIGYLMAVDAPLAVFVWQIGILPEYRGRGLSHVLIENAVIYAKRVSKNLEVTIAEENYSSYYAFHAFSEKNGYPLERLNEVDIFDSEEHDLHKLEIRYRMKII